MKFSTVARVAIIGLSLYYSGNKRQPNWLQSSVIITSLAALVEAANDLMPR